jgi:hypothetical protein
MSTLVKTKTKSKSSTTKNAAAPVSFDDPAAHKAIVPANPVQVQAGFLEGDIGWEDIKLPRLDLKHAVDTRFANVTPGHYVYSRSPEDYLPLIPPFPVIFPKVQMFIQVVEQGEVSLTCYSKAELTELGGTTNKNRPDLTLFGAFCDTLILIEQSAHPEWPDTVLLDIGGTKMALATYRIKGSAYSEIGSVLINGPVYQALAKQVPSLLWEQIWKLGSMLRKGQTFTYQVPTLVRLRKTTPAEAQACKELVENL